ncbi:ABC transporter substrate-binding protein [Paenibacillus sp. LPE1-1-1.1]|uniref:ABC transporter substrate-binding protein n=1 Tax=Paenibacillus sp. LPE1-1-1.1 TaxID=3135230 RepID=UPI00343C5A1F
MKRKQSARLGLIFLLCFGMLLSACSSGNNGSGSAANGSTGNKEEGAGNTPQEQVKISFMGHGSPQEKDIFTKLIKSYETKYPNVKVEYTSVPPAEYNQKLSTLVASGKTPDVFYVSGPQFYKFAEAGTIQNLQPFLETTELFQEDNVWKQALDRYRYDGKQLGQGDLYGLPKDVGPWAMAYNKTMFEEAGVELPPAEVGKWTWDNWLDAAKKLTKDDNGDGKVDIYGGANFTLEGAVWASGGDFIDYGTGKVTIDTPEFANAMQWVADLRLKHNVTPSPEDEKAMNSYSRFVAGKVGMFPMGPWDQPGFWDLPFEWDIAAWPVNPATGKAGTWVGSMGYSVSSKSKHAQEAFNLAAFLALDAEGQKQNYELGQAVPNLIDMAKGEFVAFDKAPANRKVFLDIIEDYGHPPVEFGSKDTKWIDTMWQEAGKVWDGKMTAADWAKEMQPKLQELYDKGNK